MRLNGAANAISQTTVNRLKQSFDRYPVTNGAICYGGLPTLYELTETRRHIRRIQTYFPATFSSLGTGTLELPSPVALRSDSSDCANRFFYGSNIQSRLLSSTRVLDCYASCINYRVAQNKRTPGSLIKFVI